jgi:hypothetical protein
MAFAGEEKKVVSEMYEQGILGPLQTPNGIARNSNKPYLVTKAVFGTSSRFTGI